jgi:exopolysaccharide production protein ExoZ
LWGALSEPGREKAVLNSIQSLRALATFTVVAYHALALLEFHAAYFMGGKRPDIPQLSAGIGALDVFFVLSGFIMIYITKDSETPGGFLFKRFSRIAPLYWIMTTLTIAIALKARWIFPHANLSALSVLCSYLFIPYPDINGALRPVLYVGWTLNIEILFFAAFALALMLPLGRRTAGLVLTLGTVWLIGKALSGLTPVAHFYGEKYTVDLMIGCLLAPAARLPQVVAFAKRTPMRPFIVGAGVVLCMLGPLTFGHVVLTSYALCVPAGVLVMACALQDLHREPTKRSLLSFYGDCSYSIYLIHIIVLPLVASRVFRLFGASSMAPVTALTLELACVLALGPLVHLFVELKCSELLRRAFGASPRQPLRARTS